MQFIIGKWCEKSEGGRQAGTAKGWKKKKGEKAGKDNLNNKYIYVFPVNRIACLKLIKGNDILKQDIPRRYIVFNRFENIQVISKLVERIFNWLFTSLK